MSINIEPGNLEGHFRISVKAWGGLGGNGRLDGDGHLGRLPRVARPWDMVTAVLVQLERHEGYLDQEG